MQQKHVAYSSTNTTQLAEYWQVEAVGADFCRSKIPSPGYHIILGPKQQHKAHGVPK